MIKVQSVYTVAVVGSRRLIECPALLARLNELHAAGQLGQLVSGGSAGIDTLAATWARARGVDLVELRPDYRAHGAGAPHVRNAEIVRRAGLVLVCWDGQSRGTLSAARAAVRQGRPCEWLVAPAPSAGPVAGGLGL
ncbi:DUF2493 domain-containing protein [Hymenobacter latericus]|uniref:DUF2493 domain-containing protein n=1 Tax=Hymenobacter sp. YIM 151858-1 TaxID=2987688 RepID=UPI0022276AFE|nr:DUF2493 domain-containing protein [Hymenobacter sp. YIM 151858-1]UYZ60202.1 DUF2493 domain-containing protein [Hymenobacter sp. YIM 151858-1]